MFSLIRTKNRYKLTMKIIKLSETNYRSSSLQLRHLISKTLTLFEGTNSQCKKRDRSVLEDDYQLNFWKNNNNNKKTQTQALLSYIKHVFALSARSSPCRSQGSCNEKSQDDISPLIAIGRVSQVPNSIVPQIENSQLVTYYCQLEFEILFC